MIVFVGINLKKEHVQKKKKNLKKNRGEKENKGTKYEELGIIGLLFQHILSFCNHFFNNVVAA
jgi:hypothetical protein